MYFDLDGDAKVYVEIDADDSGYEPAGRLDDLAAKATHSLQNALELIVPTAESVLSNLRCLSEEPSTAEVEFGVKLNLKVGAAIAASTSEGHLKVRLSWAKPQEMTPE